MIYRVHYYSHTHGSQGFSFHARRRDAEASAREYRRESSENETTVHQQPTPKSKDEVLRLLQEWANHPDNG